MFLYTYDELKRITQTAQGKKLVDEARKAYETQFRGKPIIVNDYRAFKLIYQTGNRDDYQKNYYERRKRFSFLQLLAVADDSYLDELEDILAAIVEEYTWVLPAHNLQKDTNTFDYTVIDLFSSETGYYLAETAYIFQDKLSPDIKNRIKAEIKRKIIDNFESRKQLWEGLYNNWAAVCAGSVGIAYLYAFPERFEGVKPRLFQCFENFLSSLTEEGVCLEGVGYWVYGFGFLLQFFDLYEQLKGNLPDFMKTEKIRRSLQYAVNACLGGKCYLPFADGGHKESYLHPAVAYAAKRLYGDKFSLPNYYEIDEEFVYNIPQNTGKASALRTLYGVDRYGLKEKTEQKEQTVYYQESQIFICKKKNYSLAVKCGTNAEHHNHNDVASFQIVVDGKGTIVDPGPAKYTWQYFKDNAYRYSEETFAAGSMGHSVPIVNGKYQLLGVEEGFQILEVTGDLFKFDFAAAYEGVESLIAFYQALENGVRVRYDCKGVEESVTFRFLSFNKPKQTDKGLNVGVTVRCLSGIEPIVKEIRYKGHVNILAAKDEEVIYAIDFPVVRKGNLQAEFEFLLD